MTLITLAASFGHLLLRRRGLPIVRWHAPVLALVTCAIGLGTAVFVPVDLGTIRGFKTRFHLYTVPGQVYYNASRKLILKGVDGIVFVTDSQMDRMEANLESMQNLYDNMQEYGYDLTKMPFVIQYNKRDLPNAAPIEELQAALNPGWEVTDPGRQRHTPDPTNPAESLVLQLTTGEWVEHAPAVEAVAVTGDGVFDTLRTVSKLVLKSLS